MVKKYYLFAIGSCLLIPVVIMLGATVVIFIDPEIALRTSNYERNFRLLELARALLMWTSVLIGMLLWVLAFFFLLKAKERSYWWLPLAILGPFGLIVFMMLNDNAPAPQDLHQQFIQRQKLYIRIAYETIFFVAVWVIAYQLVVLKRNLLIMYESATTGVPVAQIINIQNASSGMWAFSEGLEELFLVVLFYLLWPVCFNVVARLCRGWVSSGQA